MKTYRFTISIAGLTTDTDGYDELLFEAGCDDGLVCSYNKRIYIEFDREADNARGAIESAIKDIESAGAKVVAINEAGPVTLAEAAHMAELSKSALTRYEKGERGSGFPDPVHLGNTAIWLWRDIVYWLFQAGNATEEMIEVADAAELLAQRLRGARQAA